MTFCLSSFPVCLYTINCPIRRKKKTINSTFNCTDWHFLPDYQMLTSSTPGHEVEQQDAIWTRGSRDLLWLALVFFNHWMYQPNCWGPKEWWYDIKLLNISQSFILRPGVHKWDTEWWNYGSNWDTCIYIDDTDLSVQAGCYCDYVSSLAVDGEHVGDGAVGCLWEDAVEHHAVSCGGIVRVGGCHLHHRRACGEKVS